MKACYINGIGNVSIQSPSFNIFQDIPETISHVNYAQQPSYKELIAPAMSRRMAKGIKMSIYATNQALNEANVDELDAILIGTSLGCIEDSEKFLQAVIENEEEYLTPTAFIQSTHNTVSGQIALQWKAHAYNFTFVNGGSSFESAVFDGLLRLRFHDAKHILIGGVDEIAPYTYSMFERIARVKKIDDAIDFHQPTTAGVPYAEGATFFVLSTDKTPSTYAQVIDVSMQNAFHTIDEWIGTFLKKHRLNTVDAVVFGINADVNQQGFYTSCSKYFENTPQLYYQHISGSYDTASAFGLKLAAQVIKNQEIPDVIKYNSVEPNQLHTILLIHQSLGTDFSLTLLQHA